MKLIFRIARTELATLFFSPIAWFILIVFSILASNSFVDDIISNITTLDLYIGKEYNASVSYNVFCGDYGFFNALTQNLYIYIPLLTMGLLSREFASGSIKLLYSSPVTSSQIIIGKYVATLAYGFVLLIVPIISMVFTACVIPNFDWGPVLAAFLGLYLLMSAYCAIGLFMSSMTSYQVVAAVGTLIMLAVLSFIGNMWQEYEFVREITYWLSISGRIRNMLNGVIRSEDLLYFIIVISIFLSVTIMRIYYSRTTVSKVKSIGSYVGVIAIALTIGYITSKPQLTWFVDCTATKSQTITKESQGVLDELKGEVTITNYVNLIDSKSFNYLPRFYKQKENLFRQYQTFKPDLKIKYVYYYDETPFNGLRNNPAHADKTVEELRNYMAIVYELNARMFKSPEEIKKIVDLSGEQNSFVRIVETEDGKKTYLRDFNDMIQVPTENEITAALSKMLGKRCNVGFIKGHGERELYRPGDIDYSAFTTDKYSRYALMNQGFDITEIDFAKGDNIPQNIDVVVISEFKTSYSKEDIDKIKNYVDNGGNMLILTDVKRQREVNPILNLFGIKAEEGVVVQPIGDFYPNLILAKATPESKELAYGFGTQMLKRNKRVSLPGAVALSDINSTQFKKMNVLVTNSKGAWVESSDINFKYDTPTMDSDKGEKEGQYSVAMAATRQIDGKEQRVMVIGDSDCFSNAEMAISRSGYLSGNYDMITESFRWLSNGQYPIDTRRAEYKDNKITIKSGSTSYIKVLFLLIVPALMLAGAIMIWLVRRRN